MEYDFYIFVLNTFTIALLVSLAVMLCLATRFKGVGSYAAVVILLTTVPDYIYNVCDYFDWNALAIVTAPFAYSANLTLIPFLLLMVYRSFNPEYTFRHRTLLHFLPALIFGGLVTAELVTLSPFELQSFSVERTAGFRTPLTGVNFSIIFLQLVVYFIWIFKYLHNVKRYIKDNLSQAELANVVWVPRFITFMGFLVIAAMVASHFDPLGGFRFFYLINVLAMGFVLYSEFKIAISYRQGLVVGTVVDMESVPPPKNSPVTSEEMEQLRLYAKQVEDYLASSKAYTDPSLSLRDVSKSTGIPYNKISRAINVVLNKSFFDLVNTLRIEKSKDLLIRKKEKGLTLETIAEQCGFNSQVTFCNAFKRVLGMTTSQWLKMVK